MAEINTGEIESARQTPKENWKRLVQKWQGFAVFFPDDCRKLKQMRQECEELGMWNELGYNSEEEFFQDGLLLDYRVVELACLALDVTDEEIGLDDAVSKGEEIANSKAKGNTTVRAIAEDTGIPKSTVHDNLSGKTSLDTKTRTKEKRKVTQINISQYTTPETAAQKIRAKFGDDFADQLKEAL